MFFFSFLLSISWIAGLISIIFPFFFLLDDVICWQSHVIQSSLELLILLVLCVTIFLAKNVQLEGEGMSSPRSAFRMLISGGLFKFTLGALGTLPVRRHHSLGFV